MTHPMPSGDDIFPEFRTVSLDSGVDLAIVHWLPPREVQTRGRPWLLVHGLASNARLWDGVARRLAGAGHEVVAVDQRGHGHSSKPDDGFDVVTCADDLALLISDLEWEQPAVAGQSWGASVALELGYRHADSVSLIACVDGGFSDLQDRFPQWDEAADMLAPPKLAGAPLSTVEEWIAQSAGDWPPEGQTGTMANFEVRSDGTIAPWLSFERHMKVLHGLWEYRPSTRYAELKVPVLLLPADSGDVSWTSSKEDGVDAALALLPVGRAVWFRPAHHDVHAQQPEAVSRVLHLAASDDQFFSVSGDSQ